MENLQQLQQHDEGQLNIPAQKLVPQSVLTDPSNTVAQENAASEAELQS